MNYGSCPCCGARNLKKLQGEKFTCLDCEAPLLFTWGWVHWGGIVAYIALSNTVQQFSDPVRYGVPVVSLIILLILYFRFRRFHLDEFGTSEALNAAQDELRHIDKFITRKVGVIDFIDQLDELKTTYAKESATRMIINDHFNRIGGLSIEEQENRFAEIHPYVDLKSIAFQQQEETKKRIERLKAYQIKA